MIILSSFTHPDVVPYLVEEDILVTKELLVAIDFHIIIFFIWKSMATSNGLVTKISSSVLRVRIKYGFGTTWEWESYDRIVHLWVNYPFNII